MTIPRITSLVLTVLLAAGAGAWWWSRAERNPEPQFRTAQIERGAIVATVTSSGTINPVGSVSVGSQVSGQLREVLADFNSQVRAGEVIARIDPETFRHRVAQAEADLLAARAQVLVQKSLVEARRADLARTEVALVESRRDLARSEDLVKRGFISEAERDKAVSLVLSQEQELAAGRAGIEVAIAQVRNSEAVVRQREASVAAARVDLERTVIRSPVDGVVIKRAVDAGQTVAASLQAPELFVIARNLSDMQVDTSIDETDIGRIRTGQTASFTVDAYPGRRFSGTISQVRMAATSVQNVITYNVIVTFSNAEGMLLPGMTANVRIATETREDVLKVPNAALRLRIAGLTDVAGPSRPGETAGQTGTPVHAAVPGQGGVPPPRPPVAGADIRGAGRIWLLENGEPRMVEVRTGISDGLTTEISASGLQAGATVIVGAVATSARRSTGLRLF